MNYLVSILSLFSVVIGNSIISIFHLVISTLLSSSLGVNKIDKFLDLRLVCPTLSTVILLFLCFMNLGVILLLDLFPLNFSLLNQLEVYLNSQ